MGHELACLLDEFPVFHVLLLALNSNNNALGHGIRSHNANTLFPHIAIRGASFSAHEFLLRAFISVSKRATSRFLFFNAVVDSNPATVWLKRSLASDSRSVLNPLHQIGVGQLSDFCHLNHHCA
jgi:hypothetical protein